MWIYIFEFTGEKDGIDMMVLNTNCFVNYEAIKLTNVVVSFR
jgi:hypothetical protein